MTFDTSSATVALAAQAVGCAPERIVKTLSFKGNDGCIVVAISGDRRVDNAKFKKAFGCKAQMPTPEETLALTGHPVGGVCPFALGDDVMICLDESLRRFDRVYPAAGAGNSAVALSVPELAGCLPRAVWVDICRDDA